MNLTTLLVDAIISAPLIFSLFSLSFKTLGGAEFTLFFIVLILLAVDAVDAVDAVMFMSVLDADFDVSIAIPVSSEIKSHSGLRRISSL